MNFFRIARVHARNARRQSALWIVSILLTLLAFGIACIAAPDLASSRGTQVDLAFLGQMLGLVPAIAYAAAFTDLASAPAKLGIMEVEDSTPILPAKLLAARAAGMLSVALWPSAAVLLVCGFLQAAGGFQSVLIALAVFAAIVVPCAFLATALSALIGSLLPRALARITAVTIWCAVVCFTTFAPMPVGNRSKMGVVTDAICQGFFGCQPVIDLDVAKGIVYTPFDAILLLVLRMVLALAFIAAAAFISRRRSFRRG